MGNLAQRLAAILIFVNAPDAHGEQKRTQEYAHVLIVFDNEHSKLKPVIDRTHFAPDCHSPLPIADMGGTLRPSAEFPRCKP